MVASPYAVIDHSKVHNKTKQLDVGDADYEQQVSLARKERRMVDSRVQVRQSLASVCLVCTHGFCKFHLLLHCICPSCLLPTN